MASAPYLDQHLESLKNLPMQLLRNFTLMRYIDSKAQEELRDIDKMAGNFMSNIKQYSGNKKNVAIMQRKFDKAKEYSDDKVQLSIQSCEYMDTIIRKLDIDLVRHKSEIQNRAISAKKNAELIKRGREKNRGIWLRVTSDEVAARYEIPNKKQPKKGFSNTSCAAQSKRSPVRVVSNPINPTKSVASAAVDNAPLTGLLLHSNEISDMPVDPNEPTYCLCNQVSYGEMIGCDNPDCPIEWFHFACVKLTTKPKGKWYCSKCITNKKKK